MLQEDVERITRHDLKTPLNAVINFPRLMMKDPQLTPKHKNYLSIIEQAGLQMLNMINLSLNLLKMERGSYQLKPDEMDILEIIKRIFIENRPVMERKALWKIIRIDGKSTKEKEEYPMLGEEMLCYSMLANLIKNALEASPENQAVTIDLFAQKDGTIIAINNKGVVPENIRDRFFDKYVTFGKKSGSGLGTYSARLIAETHEGGIQLDTSDEKGTTVTIRLPLKTNADPAMGGEI